MLIKEADVHNKRLAFLEALQGDPALNRTQSDWLNNQIWALRMGLSGERNAAHYINHYYKDSQNLAVIHDLRLEMDDEVAQIDHLIITRGFFFYLLETKSFAGNLSINEHGEFTVHYSSGSRGIPSPLEQSRRHEKILAKWLDRLDIHGRFGAKPQFYHAVLIDPKGTIERPDARKFDTSDVIKADQIDVWRNKHIDKVLTVGKTLSTLFNIHGGDVVREWGEALARQHRPLQPSQWLPEFMKPSPVVKHVPQVIQTVPLEVDMAAKSPVVKAVNHVSCAVCGKALTAAEQNFCGSRVSVFGGRMLCMTHQHEKKKENPVARQNGDRPKPVRAPVEPVTEDSRQRKLVCCTCDAKISYEEGKFCWNNERRFAGLQYCRTHQADFR